MTSIGSVDSVELLSKEITQRLQGEQISDSELFLVIQRIMQLSVRLFSSSRVQNKMRSQKELDLMLEQLSKHCKQIVSWKNFAPQMVAGIGSVAAGGFGIYAQAGSLPHTLASMGDRDNVLLQQIAEQWKTFASYGQFGGQAAQAVPGALSMMSATMKAEETSSNTHMQIHNSAKSANEQSAHQDLTSQKALQAAAEQAAQAYSQAGRAVAQ